MTDRCGWRKHESAECPSHDEADCGCKAGPAFVPCDASARGDEGTGLCRTGLCPFRSGMAISTVPRGSSKIRKHEEVKRSRTIVRNDGVGSHSRGHVVDAS